MRLEKLTYQKLFVTGSFMNERIGVEYAIDETEDVTVAFNTIRSQVDELFKQSHPELYKVGELPVQITEETIKDQKEKVVQAKIDTMTEEERIDSLRNSITFSQTENDLKSFRIVVYSKQGNAELQGLYEARLRELKNK